MNPEDVPATPDSRRNAGDLPGQLETSYGGAFVSTLSEDGLRFDALLGVPDPVLLATERVGHVRASGAASFLRLGERYEPDLTRAAGIVGLKADASSPRLRHSPVPLRPDPPPPPACPPRRLTARPPLRAPTPPPPPPRPPRPHTSAAPPPSLHARRFSASESGSFVGQSASFVGENASRRRSLKNLFYQSSDRS